MDIDVILSVKDLKVYFYTKRGVGTAVDGTTFDLHRGETLGLVGESGSGKSITALAIMGLHPKPAAQIVGGQILFDGKDLTQLASSEVRRYRGKRIAMVLQEPQTALNPVFTIKDQLGETLREHRGLKGQRLVERAVELLKLLQIPSPIQRLKNYPHHFSGGMLQRIVGAIALSGDPEILIADEPTTSLDVTLQAAYLALLKKIQKKTSLAILFITHDFGVVAKMCDRVAVMYAGRIVETAPAQQLLESPAHPYTEALLKAVPDLREGTKRLDSIEGNPPSMYNKPKGCPFAPRCPYVMDRCHEEYPPVVEIMPGNEVYCWRYV